MSQKQVKTSKEFTEQFQLIEDEGTPGKFNTDQLTKAIELITKNTKIIKTLDIPKQESYDKDYIVIAEILSVIGNLPYKDRSLYLEKLSIVNPDLTEFIYNKYNVEDTYLSEKNTNAVEVNNLNEFYTKIDGNDKTLQFITKYSTIQPRGELQITDKATLKELITLLSNNTEMIKTIQNPANINVSDKDIIAQALIRIVVASLTQDDKINFMETLKELNPDLASYLQIGLNNVNEKGLEIDNLNEFTSNPVSQTNSEAPSWLADLYTRNKVEMQPEVKQKKSVPIKHDLSYLSEMYSGVKSEDEVKEEQQHGKPVVNNLSYLSEMYSRTTPDSTEIEETQVKSWTSNLYDHDYIPDKISKKRELLNKIKEYDVMGDSIKDYDKLETMMDLFSENSEVLKTIQFGENKMDLEGILLFEKLKKMIKSLDYQDRMKLVAKLGKINLDLYTYLNTDKDFVENYLVHPKNNDGINLETKKKKESEKSIKNRNEEIIDVEIIKKETNKSKLIKIIKELNNGNEEIIEDKKKLQSIINLYATNIPAIKELSCDETGKVSKEDEILFTQLKTVLKSLNYIDRMNLVSKLSIVNPEIMEYFEKEVSFNYEYFISQDNREQLKCIFGPIPNADKSKKNGPNIPPNSSQVASQGETSEVTEIVEEKVNDVFLVDTPESKKAEKLMKASVERQESEKMKEMVQDKLSNTKTKLQTGRKQTATQTATQR